MLISGPLMSERSITPLFPLHVNSEPSCVGTVIVGFFMV
jgi:hypothetical protein